MLREAALGSLRQRITSRVPLQNASATGLTRRDERPSSTDVRLGGWDVSGFRLDWGDSAGLMLILDLSLASSVPEGNASV